MSRQSTCMKLLLPSWGTHTWAYFNEAAAERPRKFVLFLLFAEVVMARNRFALNPAD